MADWVSFRDEVPKYGFTVVVEIFWEERGSSLDDNMIETVSLQLPKSMTTSFGTYAETLLSLKLFRTPLKLFTLLDEE